MQISTSYAGSTYRVRTFSVAGVDSEYRSGDICSPGRYQLSKLAIFRASCSSQPETSPVLLIGKLACKALVASLANIRHYALRTIHHDQSAGQYMTAAEDKSSLPPKIKRLELVL